MKNSLSKLLFATFICTALAGAGFGESSYKWEYPKVPGTPIAHFPASGGKYIGSPTICVLPNGNYVAAHDLFGPKADHSTNARTLVYQSTDKGETWEKIADVNQFWSNLFWHNNALWLMGTQNAGRNCVIRKSTDGGKTWTEPTDENSGLIRKGRYHTAPTPVLLSKGRIWRAMEHNGLNSVMFSADENADLLKASSWERTEPLDLGSQKCAISRGWLEGNAVERVSDGKIVTILRVYGSGDTAAALVDINSPTESKFRNDFIRIPGASKKFTIRYDPVSKYYFALVNDIPENMADISVTFKFSPDGKVTVIPSENLSAALARYPDPTKELQRIIDSQPWLKRKDYVKPPKIQFSQTKVKSNGDGTYTDISNKSSMGENMIKYTLPPDIIRNMLSLAVSKDLYDWKVVTTIAKGWNPISQAFQYPDWQFDGDDIVIASRTAWFDGEAEAKNMHDANYMTFHRIKNFRRYAK